VNKICLHATSVSLDGTGVLLRGPSGAGKSSLALQLLETVGTGLTGGSLKPMLISDDQTELTVRDGIVFASPPQALAGLLEVRGQDFLQLPFVRDVPLVLVVDLQPAFTIERLPDVAQLTTTVLGVTLSVVAIDGTHPSAAARVRVAFARCQKPVVQTLAPVTLTA
jgi:HPr kinase/phosphorylase